MLRRLFYLMRKEASEAAAADNQERYDATIRDIASAGQP